MTPSHHKTNLYLLLIAVMVVVITSCSKDDFNPDLEASDVWQPNIAFPLAYSEIGIDDFAQANDSTTIIITDNDQFCTLVYRNEVFDLRADQLIQLPDQSVSTAFSLNNSEILTLNNSGQVHISQSRDLQFQVSQGIEIDSVLLKNSSLVIDYSSDFPMNSELTITIPGLIKNNIAFSQIIPLVYSGTAISGQLSIPLHMYHMDLTKNGTTHNTLQVFYDITIQGNGSSASPGNSIQCNAGFHSLEFQNLFGFTGQQYIANIPDSVELSIFNNALGTGSFTVAEPLIRFDISNSLGIPFNARISQLTAINTNQSNFVVATGLPDPLPVVSPTIAQAGQTLYSSFTLNNSNSNITSLIDEQPGFILVQSQIATNPAGHSINFMTDSSRLAMNIHVELPLYGTASDFKIRDTLPFNYNDLENVEQLTLRLNIENWFPLEADIQLIFTDENYNGLDTLFVPGEVLIPSGIIPANSERVLMPGKKIQDHTFDKSRILRLLNAKNILIEAGASSYQNGSTNVKIYNDYKLKIKIGAIAKTRIQ